jgi:alanyl aminopeptidase
MSRLSIVILVLGACSSSRPAAVSPPPVAANRPAAGTAAAADAVDPPQPTLRLPRNFLPTAYRARLAVDPASDRFTGAIEIDGDVQQRSKRLWLHGRGLKVTAAKIVRGDRTLRVEVASVGEDLLSFQPAEPLEPGRITIALDYGGAFETVDQVSAFKRTFEGNVYVETQFESIYARRVFPCFDEPGSKVPWQLTLDVPSALVAVGNTPVASETALGAGTKRVVFAPTRPLPSYLIAFGVGPFEMVDAGKTRNGTPIRIIALKGRTADARWAAETTPRIVQLLEDYFGTPYPYEKLDQLAQPLLLGGAMENPGLVTYATSIILHPPAQITHADRLNWVDTAAHELAHQWFGDLVTTAWWDDIWLNEGFASWLGAKIVRQFEPAWRGELLTADERNQGLSSDSQVTARRIREPIAAVADIFQAFDNITYAKGHSVLAMFEHAIGPERFRDGVRAYLAKHRNGSATSADFLAAISAVAGHDVAPAFNTFLDQPGAPVVRAELRCEAGQPPALQLSQRRHLVPGSPPVAAGTPWQLPVCVAYDRGGARGETCVELATASVEIALDTQRCPAWVFPNAGGHGYYRSSQPDRALAALRDHGWKLLTPVERIVAFHDLSALTDIGEVDLSLELSLVPRLLAEHHHVAIAAARGVAGQALFHVSPARVPAVDAWIRRTFGPAARALSWQRREHDDYDAEQSRAELVPQVAWSGDPELRAAAVKLAADVGTLDRALRSQILGVAADADTRTFDRLLSAVPDEKDVELRHDMLRALRQVSSASRLQAVLALTWDRRLDREEARSMVFAGRTREQREITAAYFRDHVTQLLERFPPNGDEGTAVLGFSFFRGCDAGKRDDVAAFVKQTFGAMIGADRVIAQGLEGLDQCIAIRRLLQPKLDAWIQNQR